MILVYEAAILQNTGEVCLLVLRQFRRQSWENVSLTLETATPTFGLAIPELTPWWLSEYRPWKYSTRSCRALSGRGRSFATQLVARQRDVVDFAETVLGVLRII